MKIGEIQASLVAAVMADPVLAAYGEPIVATPFADEAVVEALIGERLRSPGVVIEIGYPSAARSSARELRGTAATASVDLLVAESPTVSHAPAGLALQQRIVDAVQGYAASRAELPAEFESIETAVTEHGYVLHVISFTKAVIV